MRALKVIVGLGNPGPAYEGSPHNLGFLVLDRLAQEASASWKAGSQGLVSCVALRHGPVWLLKPQTFMNHSGRALCALLADVDVALSEVLVVHDELDLPSGSLKLKQGGGSAGHNGVRSIRSECGGSDFYRLRVGVGRPAAGSVTDYLLTPLPVARRPEFERTLHFASEAVVLLEEQGFEAAAAVVNRKPKGAECGPGASLSEAQGAKSSPPREGPAKAGTSRGE